MQTSKEEKEQKLGSVLNQANLLFVSFLRKMKTKMIVCELIIQVFIDLGKSKSCVYQGRKAKPALLLNREFKIYDATVAKTSLKIASSNFSIYSVIMSVCLTFES